MSKFTIDKNIIDKRIELKHDSSIFLDGKEITVHEYRAYLQKKHVNDSDGE